MTLYTPEGWLDLSALRREALPFTWIWGGRGIGKTFGALKSLRYDDPAPFILLRRTQTMIDIMCNDDFSPFRAVDEFTGRKTVSDKLNKYIVAFYDADDENKPHGPPVAYAMALSTIHNVRGFSAPVDWIVYDEFIPEAHERPIQREYEAFQNAYETINRNRELQGKEPVKVLGLSNANRLDNPYFTGMGVVGIVDKMTSKGREIYRDTSRGIMLVNVVRSPISSAKEATALYRLSEGSDFAEMSLHNAYAYECKAEQRRVPLQECIPVVGVGDLTVYRHKADGYFYTARVRAGSPEMVYTASRGDLIKFLRRWWYLYDAYLDGKMVFPDYETEVVFRAYCQKTA